MKVMTAMHAFPREAWTAAFGPAPSLPSMAASHTTPAIRRLRSTHAAVPKRKFS